jgi:signal peptidase I
MQQLNRLCQRFRQCQSHRWLVAILLSSLAGIAFGRIVKDSLPDSVAVVEGTSMMPTFKPGARVFSSPIQGPLNRGDIVLLNDAAQEFAIKRIVGMPGETVQLWRGHVFINGRMLREPYLLKNMFTVQDDWSTAWSFKIGQDQYFVLGDNRFDSIDSRAYGPVNRSQIKSRVPQAADTLQADFAPYRLPPRGKRMIEEL